MFKSLPTFKSLPQAIGLPFLSSQEDAQLKFRSGENGIRRLYGDQVIPPTDVEYWSQYYTLFASAQDVYGLISAQDVRQTLIAQPANLASLLTYLAHHLFSLLHSELFPSTGRAPAQDTTREALNCLRVLGRIVVIVYEAEGVAREGGVSGGEAFAREHLWARQTVRKEGKPEEQFTITDSDDEGEGSDPLSKLDDTEVLPSLADRLFQCTIDLLFCAGFTLPSSVQGGSDEKVHYVIWEKGVGSTASLGSTADLDRNRVEVLRFLMILLSTTMYTSPHALQTTLNGPLSHMTHSLERRLVLSLLCSFLNTSLATARPTTVGQIPYNHLISKSSEEKRELTRACLMVLLVALDHKEPGVDEMREGKEENAFKFFVSKLHRKEDFAFILNGIMAIFEEQTAVSSAYLPGSKRPVPYLLEIFMLLWRLIDLNKRFRQYIFDNNRASDLIAYILLCSLDLKDDPAQHGLLRLAAYLLQNLSADQPFAEALNMPVRLNVPAKWAVAGNTSDLLIVSIYSIATTPGLNPLFPALCITIANVAPHLRGLGTQASTRLLQLFKAFSSPIFLLADEGHPRLVYYLLDTFNSILNHQLNENPHLVYAILRSHQDFQTLGTFTLVSGLRDIQRRRALRSEINRRSDSPGLKRTQSELDMLAEKAALLGREIEDEESAQGQGQGQVQPLTTPGETNDPLAAAGAVDTRPPPPPPQPQASTPTEMSEKARGKMRARSSESVSSLPLADDAAAAAADTVPDEELMKVAMAGVGPSGYVPTQEWVSSWQKGLPLDPVLVAISELLPKIQDSQTASTSSSPSNKVFRLLKEVELGDVLPPAPAITPRRFQWSAASTVWLTSLLWGDIYVAGLTSVGVWKDTSVRLFGIKQAPVKGRGAQVGKVLKMIGVV